MGCVFFRVLDLPFHGSITALAVILLRKIFSKWNRNFFCCLWSIVFLRLVCPLSIPFRFACLPQNPFMESKFAADIQERQYSGISTVKLLFILWIIGFLLMLLYQAFCAWKIHKTLKHIQHFRDNIFISPMIKIPFVIGVFSARIFLPNQISDESLDLILVHEKRHITHHDNLRKMLAWIVLSIHWFNPVVWLSYRLFSVDIELSCDESVVSTMDKAKRKRYAHAVLCQTAGVEISAFTSFFGTLDVRERVNRILRYQCVSRKRKVSYYAVLIMVLFVTLTGVSNVRTETLSLAKSWVENNFGESYELQNLEAALIRDFRTEDFQRCTVRVSCETMPKVEAVVDGWIAEDINPGDWEEMTIDIVVERKQKNGKAWGVHPAFVY